MITCKFLGFNTSEDMTPVGVLRVRGGAIYGNDDPEPFAVHVEGHWEFKGKCYTRFDVDGPLAVRLVPLADVRDEKEFLERRIWFADGVLHSPSGHIMCLDEQSNTWLDIRSGLRYSEMVLTMWKP
jgi:hypothetical protein